MQVDLESILVNAWYVDLSVYIVRTVEFLKYRNMEMQNIVVSVSVSLNMPETQNKECLLKGYFYPFPMRTRLGSGAFPFLEFDWPLVCEVATVLPALVWNSSA